MSAPAEGGHAVPFPPFDASLFAHQLIWFVISFGGLYLLMSRVVLPRVAAVLANRAAAVKADLDSAARESDAAEATRANTERARAEARAKARGMIEEVRAKAQAELAAEQEKADRALAARAEAAERTIAETRAGAMAQVDAIAADISRDIVAKLAGAAA